MTRSPLSPLLALLLLLLPLTLAVEYRPCP